MGLATRNLSIHNCCNAVLPPNNMPGWDALSCMESLNEKIQDCIHSKTGNHERRKRHFMRMGLCLVRKSGSWSMVTRKLSCESHESTDTSLFKVCMLCHFWLYAMNRRYSRLLRSQGWLCWWVWMWRKLGLQMLLRCSKEPLLVLKSLLREYCRCSVLVIRGVSYKLGPSQQAFQFLTQSRPILDFAGCGLFSENAAYWTDSTNGILSDGTWAEVYIGNVTYQSSARSSYMTGQRHSPAMKSWELHAQIHSWQKAGVQKWNFEGKNVYGMDEDMSLDLASPVVSIFATDCRIFRPERGRNLTWTGDLTVLLQSFLQHGCRSELARLKLLKHWLRTQTSIEFHFCAPQFINREAVHSGFEMLTGLQLHLLLWIEKLSIQKFAEDFCVEGRRRKFELILRSNWVGSEARKDTFSTVGLFGIGARQVSVILWQQRRADDSPIENRRCSKSATQYFKLESKAMITNLHHLSSYLKSLFMPTSSTEAKPRIESDLEPTGTIFQAFLTEPTLRQRHGL